MDGLIIINKPKGYTSHDVVNKVRKILNIKQIGHTGTLDPNATGVLPILIGNATKISKYLVEHKKTYIATIKLGEKTDTGDVEGNIIERDLKFEIIKIDDVKNTLNSFLGEQFQIPPMYSAIKINGKKLYEYARKGKKLEIPPRKIKIYKIDLIDFNNKDKIIFKVECSKGTYVRVLCEEIAKKLGTIGYMKDLLRTSVNEFTLDSAIDLEDLDIKKIEQNLIRIEDVFKEKKEINIDNKKLTLFLNGVQLTYKLKDDIYRIYNNNYFIGLGIVNNNLLKRDIII